MERNQKDDSFRLNSGLSCFVLLFVLRMFYLFSKTILKILSDEIRLKKILNQFIYIINILTNKYNKTKIPQTK